MAVLTANQKTHKPLKVVVWDLDNTIWEGTLLERDACIVFPQVAALLQDLDDRGVLNSIASRNDAASAVAHLARQGIGHYFLAPQIGWGAKSVSIQRIAEKLNISVDAMLFIDDSRFELAEAAFALPTLNTLDAADMSDLMRRYSLQDMVATPEARRRRQMYIDDFARSEAEQDFKGPSDAFMASLELVLSVRLASPADLVRAEELTLRTNQLNSTGISYSKVELNEILDTPPNVLLVAELKDRFGDYGVVALMLLDTESEGSRWLLKLILVSCRVMSRGVGTILLNHLHERARSAGRQLEVAFRSSGKNRAMRVALMMSGFKPSGGANGEEMAFSRLGDAVRPPCWLRLNSSW